MKVLFEIETDKVFIRWQGPARIRYTASGDIPGHIRVNPRRSMRTLIVWRDEVPEELHRDFQATEGPRLYEQTIYHLIVRPKGDFRATLSHRDTTLIAAQSIGEPGEPSLYTVNFGSQVGFSNFEVRLDGQPEVDFEVEVFPSKIDYKSDYDQMLAEITNFLMGLSLEYLKATYRSGQVTKAPEPTDIEWLTILRQVIGDLEQAVSRIEQRPHRRLTREYRFVRPEKSRRAAAAMRRAIHRGQGRGSKKAYEGSQGIPWIREYIQDQRAVESLDTPEHRWLKRQLLDIRRRITWLIQAEGARGRTPGRRRRSTIAELKRMESSIVNLLKVEPVQEAVGDPPANFSSLVLQGTTGYREAYTTCLILRLGLRLEGGPFQLSLKDISALYEYWCYLNMLKIVSDELGVEIDPKSLFRHTSNGLRVDLERGRSKQIVLRSRDKSNTPKLALAYNPKFIGPTGANQPDVGLSISTRDWPHPFEIILDAKYRVDERSEYVRAHKAVGPPEDTINVLHRYRDAILMSLPEGNETSSRQLKRRTIMGVVLFPYRDANGNYENGDFFRSLDAVGIGALPFLPSQESFVRKWLGSVLEQSGWSLAERLPGHITEPTRLAWQVEATHPVLIAVLRPGVNQLEWVKRKRLYYAPLNRLGKRRFATKWIAFFQSKSDRGEVGAISCEAEVLDMDVKPRGEIKTPWRASRPDELQLVFELGPVRERERPIVVERGIRSFRWASWLSLNRAQNSHELYIETEPEWRLYDAICARGVRYQIKPGDPRVVDPDDIKGRAEFKVGSLRIKYAGAAGFRMDIGEDVAYCSDVDDVIGIIESRRELT